MPNLIRAPLTHFCRVWKDTDPTTAPEVYHTLEAMTAEGVDFMLDVHGDEELPVRMSKEQGACWTCMVIKSCR